ncbi:MAG: DNA repair protein RadC [Bacteroidales bacterium]|nr:DNA repair protein RadC [Bacteroidales bacterium]
MKRKSIKTWDEEERPREKLMLQGASALTNVELLAILIKSGTSQMSALDLSREILLRCEGRLGTLSREGSGKLMDIAGIGPAKAAAIAATFELARRLAAEIPPEDLVIRTSETVARMMAPQLRDLPHEECWAIYLNRGSRLIGKERVSQGGMGSTVIDIKIIVKKAVDHLASGLILVHNHPSGNPTPGGQDRDQTEALRKALSVFDIALIDHVVISRNKYFSFSDEVTSRL